MASPEVHTGTNVEPVLSLTTAQMDGLLEAVRKLMDEHRSISATVENLVGSVQQNLAPEQVSTLAFLMQSLRKVQEVLVEATWEMERLQSGLLSAGLLSTPNPV